MPGNTLQHSHTALPLSARGRRVTAVLIIALLALTNSRAIILIFREHLLAYFHIDIGQFGAFNGISQWASIVPLLAAGWLALRLGASRLFTVGLLGAGAGLLLLAGSGSHVGLFVGGLAFAGMAMVLMEVGGTTTLIGLFPESRRRILTLSMVSRSVTEMVVPLLAEGLLKLSAVTPVVTFAAILHAPFAVVAGAFLLGSLIFARQASQRSTAPWRWRDLLVSRRSVGLLLLIMLHSIADATFFTFMPLFLTSRAFAVQLEWLPPGYVISAFSVAYIVSRLLLARMPEGWGRRSLLVLPGMLGGCVLIAALLTRNYLLTACGYVLGGFLWSVEYPTLLGRIADEEHERFGTAMALISAVSIGGTALSVTCCGAWMQALGPGMMWLPMLVVACGFPCVGLGGLAWLGAHGEMRKSA